MDTSTLPEDHSHFSFEISIAVLWLVSVVLQTEHIGTHGALHAILFRDEHQIVCVGGASAGHLGPDHGPQRRMHLQQHSHVQQRFHRLTLLAGDALRVTSRAPAVLRGEADLKRSEATHHHTRRDGKRPFGNIKRIPSQVAVADARGIAWADMVQEVLEPLVDDEVPYVPAVKNRRSFVVDLAAGAEDLGGDVIV